MKILIYILVGLLIEVILIPIIYYEINGSNCMSIYVEQYIENKHITGYIYNKHIDTLWTDELKVIGYSYGCNIYTGNTIHDMINSWGCKDLYVYLSIRNKILQ